MSTNITTYYLPAEERQMFLRDLEIHLAGREEILSAYARGSFLQDSQDVARSRLLTAMEAALNICYHITAKKLQKVPEDYAECFQLLGSARILDPELASRLSQMARFRNRLVHMYWDIDYGQVYDIITHDLKDLEEFSRQVANLI